MRFRRDTPEPVTPDITALADVVFLLLVFFVVLAATVQFAQADAEDPEEVAGADLDSCLVEGFSAAEIGEAGLVTLPISFDDSEQSRPLYDEAARGRLGAVPVSEATTMGEVVDLQAAYNPVFRTPEGLRYGSTTLLARWEEE